MSAQLREPSWRRAGCSDNCRIVVVLVIGEHHKSEIEVHDLEAHEAHGAGTTARAITETGPLVIDRVSCSVRVEGRNVRVSPTEYRLLSVLGNRPGTVLSHDALLEAVWGREWRGEHHVLRVHLARLRAKLSPVGSLIEARHGLGYALRDVPPCRAADIPPMPVRAWSPWHTARRFGRLQQQIYDELLAAGPEGEPTVVALNRTVGATDYHARQRFYESLYRLRLRGCVIDLIPRLKGRESWIAMTKTLPAVEQEATP